MADRIMEATFAMIKPHAYDHKKEIEKLFEREGFVIRSAEVRSFDKEKARKHYEEHLDKPFYKNVEKMILEGPVSMYVLVREDAISSLRELCGNTDPAKAGHGTIRKMYGKDICYNAIHASDSEKSAKKEILLHFPESKSSNLKQILDTYQE